MRIHLVAAGLLAIVGCSSAYPPASHAQCLPEQGCTGASNTGAAGTLLRGTGIKFEEQVVSDCDDTAGQHLNFTAADGFICGNSGSSSTVSGPVSSTDRAIPTFDGTDGGTLRNNAPTIDSSGNLGMARAMVKAVSGFELRGPTGNAKHEVIVDGSIVSNLQFHWPLSGPTEVGQMLGVVDIDGSDVYLDWLSPLPAYSGHSGEYLKTDGTTAFWHANAE